MRFSIGLGVLAVFTIIEIILTGIQLFGDEAYNYGFGHVGACIAINIYVFIMLLAYLLFKRENLPKFMQGNTKPKEPSSELKAVTSGVVLITTPREEVTLVEKEQEISKENLDNLMQ